MLRQMSKYAAKPLSACLLVCVEHDQDGFQTHADARAGGVCCSHTCTPPLYALDIQLSSTHDSQLNSELFHFLIGTGQSAEMLGTINDALKAVLIPGSVWQAACLHNVYRHGSVTCQDM